jgi:hypothetical protein
MTQPQAVEERQGGKTVEIAAPQLAAIHTSYEEARACIAGLASSSGRAAQDVTDPQPDTEAIDIRMVKPPAVHEATTPPTTAMSVAARFLAEQPNFEGVRSPADASGPRPQRHEASCPREGDMQAPHLRTGRPVVAHRPRRWWRAIRTTLPGAVPVPR